MPLNTLKAIFSNIITSIKHIMIKYRCIVGKKEKINSPGNAANKNKRTIE